VAATAFETALTAMVHPAVVTANRASLPKLVAMNFLGQNTTAIAANEFDYMQMWAQDVAAMVGYHSGATSVAATLAPFEGLGAHLAGLTSSLSSVVQRAEAAVPAMLSTLKALPLQEISMLMYPASMAMSPLMSMMSTAARGSTAGLAGTAATAARLPASIPKLAGGALSGVKALGAGRLGSAMSAGLGKARLVGAMSVPSTWQGSTPAGMASSAMRGMGAMHSAADLPAGAAAGRMTPMPMPMGMGGAGAGMAGMGRGGASPQVLPKRPCVVPRAGV
jgi:PPE-repeat protein